MGTVIESIFFNPWIWIVPILIVVALVLVFLDVAVWETYAIAGLGSLGVLILAGFYFGFMLVPYDGTYYQTYRITGTVESVESAFSGDEGTMSQVFIARVDGVDSFIRSDDQRFRTVHEGDHVNLVCSKEFRYFQQPWFECSFGGQAVAR